MNTPESVLLAVYVVYLNPFGIPSNAEFGDGRNNTALRNAEFFYFEL